MRKWKMLRAADDITEAMEDNIRDCVDGWFGNEPRIDTQDFIDRFCEDYGGSGWDETDFDIDDYANPAATKILKIARAYHREQRQ